MKRTLKFQPRLNGADSGVRGVVAAAVVAAGAHDLGFVGDSFAVGAAVFLIVGCNAAAGGVCTFLRSDHVYLRGRTTRVRVAPEAWLIVMLKWAQKDATAGEGRRCSAIS